MTDHDFDRALALLKSVAADHEVNDRHGDHAWRTCRACLAREELDHNGIKPLLREFIARVEAAETLIDKAVKETSGAPSIILADGQEYKVVPTALAEELLEAALSAHNLPRGVEKPAIS